jgi:MFS family permease
MRIINANYTKLFYGQAISSIGDYVFDTTLILWISTRLLAGKDYAPAAVSGVLVALAAGVIIVGPVAGVFVDRWDKRRTMMVADLVRAALVATLGVVAMLPAGTIPVGIILALIYTVVLLATGVAQFFQPARFTFIGDVVNGDVERARAAGFGQSLSFTAAVVGPPLAAPLLFQTGPYWALFINAASFVVSFLLIRAIKVGPAAAANTSTTLDPQPAAASAEPAGGGAGATEPTDSTGSGIRRRGFFGEFRSGLTYVARGATVRAVMISVTTVTLGAGALNALLVFFVTENLHTKADWYGTIGMGEGLGAIAGTLTAAWICKRLGDVRVFCYGLVVWGIGIMAFARLDNLLQAVVTLAVLGIPLGALNVALTPIMLRAIPRELLGRVVGILTPAQYLASMVSALGAGWLASTVLRDFHADIGPVTLGRIDTIFTISGLIVLIGGLYAWIALRRADVAATTASQQPRDPAVAGSVD